jgi:hypothetical protein
MSSTWARCWIVLEKIFFNLGCQLHTVGSEGALPRRISGRLQFVTVKGAYFFLPSLRALR